MTASVASVNVGKPRNVEWFDRVVRTAIWKSPVDGSVRVEGINLVGDKQADRRVHGGVDKAVYAYATEDYDWWRSSWDGDAFAPGTFGENITTSGVDLRDAVIGERWQVGSVVFEVSEPREPCFKLGIRMGTAAFVDAFEDAARFGTYLRIITEGSVTAGDAITLAHLPDDALTVAELAESRMTDDVVLLERVVSNAHVAQKWRNRAARALKRLR